MNALVHTHRRVRWMLERLVALLFVVGLLAPLAPLVPATPAQADGELGTALQVYPDSGSSAPDGGYAIGNLQLFWYAKADPARCQSAAYIERVDVLGYRMVLLNRTTTLDAQGCNPFRITSNNIVADKNFVYFVTPSGLYKLPVKADKNDPNAAQLMSTAIQGTANQVVELNQNADNIFVAVRQQNNDRVYLVAKSNNRMTVLAQEPAHRLASNGQYLFWLNNNNDLRRASLRDVSSPLFTVAQGVTAFAPNAPFDPPCSSVLCPAEGDVYFSIGKRIWKIGNYAGAFSKLVYIAAGTYTGVTEIARDDAHLYWVENRVVPVGDVFNPFQDTFVRANLDGTLPETLYVNEHSSTNQADSVVHLTQMRDTTNNHPFYEVLYFQQNARIMKVPKTVKAVQVPDLVITGIELTQGVQNSQRGVPLIKGRRTIARVYIKNLAGTAVVNNVSGRLSATWNGGKGAPIAPLNYGGTVSIRGESNRDKLDDSLYFELPDTWVRQTGLRLHAEIDPFHNIIETNISNNSLDNGVYTFVDSPRLDVQFIGWSYLLNGTVFAPDVNKDIRKHYTTLERLYPLDSSVARVDTAGVGLRVGRAMVRDDALATRVKQSDTSCAQLIDPNWCASSYVNGIMEQYHDQWDSHIPFYGVIPDSVKGVRGLTSYAQTGSGGTNANTFTPVHEIAHMLGRMHPWPGSKQDDNVCGQDSTKDGAGDTAFPNIDGSIGPNGSSIQGFDVGDSANGINRQLLLASDTYDFMSYCNKQWISDYTYEGLYKQLTGKDLGIYKSLLSNAFQPTMTTPPAGPISGDFLAVYGGIAPDGSQAFIDYARRWNRAGATTRDRPNDYSLDLLDAQGQVLVQHQLSLTPSEIRNRLDFRAIVPFVAGARTLRIQNLQTNTTLTSMPIGADRPSVSNVAVQSAAPLTGTVQLTWQASTSDGSPLRYDVLVSRDNGATFMPLQMNIAGTSTTVDTTQFGGDSIIFKVVATSGVQSSEADSAPMTLASKLLRPRILSPSNGATFTYGQVITFNGTSDELQTGDVRLSWSYQHGALGTGEVVSVNDLPVGTNVITLTAESTVGTATTSMSVNVLDTPVAPAPKLSVSPSPVVWQIAPGATGRQLSTLSVLNVGSDTMTWTASSNVPWLTLIPNSTATPGDLALIADAAALAGREATTLQGTVTVVGNVGNRVVDTVDVPVTFTNGGGGEGGVPTRAPLPPIIRPRTSQVHLLVAPGATTVQTATIEIDNAGDGDLQWSATCDTPRMTMQVGNTGAPVQGTVTGTGPNQLHLNVNPAGLTPGSTRTWNLVLHAQSAGQDVQTVTIPVSLAVDASPETPVQDQFTISLPLITR